MTYLEKLKAVRIKMLAEDIDAYIIPSSDPHMSEYVPDCYKCIHFASGFSGSAGTLVITANFAGLWTDFRYFEQAKQELAGSGFELVKLKVQHTPEYIDWLYENLPSGAVVAFDFKLISLMLAEEINSSLSAKHIVISNLNLLDEIWENRPALPSSKAFLLPDAQCGQRFDIKLQSLRSAMINNRSSLHVISSLDDIAWLFNIRGNDVVYNPVVLCYAIITLASATLYINADKFLPADLKKILADGIVVKGYDEVNDDLASLRNCSLLLDAKRTCYHFFTLLSSSVKVIRDTSPLVHLKAIKNSVEIANIRNAMIKDGVALTRFLKWLEENVGKINITEMSAADKLETFRKRAENFMGSSFTAISGYGPHAALPHYAPSEQSNLQLLPKGLFLLDTGGQYLYG
ncbi:MAG: M24 family metallopeptidase, partial [Chitinophagaceae bacterium]